MARVVYAEPLEYLSLQAIHPGSARQSQYRLGAFQTRPQNRLSIYPARPNQRPIDDSATDP